MEKMKTMQIILQIFIQMQGWGWKSKYEAGSFGTW
jgi:hypothetical protein